jgi:hypothetical protein
MARPNAATPVELTKPRNAKASATTGAAPSTKGSRPPIGVLRRSDHEPTSTGRATAMRPSPPISAPITTVEGANDDARTGR